MKMDSGGFSLFFLSFRACRCFLVALLCLSLSLQPAYGARPSGAYEDIQDQMFDLQRSVRALNENPAAYFVGGANSFAISVVGGQVTQHILTSVASVATCQVAAPICLVAAGALHLLTVCDSIERLTALYTGHKPVLVKYNPMVYVQSMIMSRFDASQLLKDPKDILWNQSLEQGQRDFGVVATVTNGLVSGWNLWKIGKNLAMSLRTAAATPAAAAPSNAPEYANPSMALSSGKSIVDVYSPLMYDPLNVYVPQTIGAVNVHHNGREFYVVDAKGVQSSIKTIDLSQELRGASSEILQKLQNIGYLSLRQIGSEYGLNFDLRLRGGGPKENPEKQKDFSANIFGAEDWERFFGPIGEEPLLPDSLEHILMAPCPIWPGRHVYETHTLTLIPSIIGGVPLTSDHFLKLIQDLKGGGHKPSIAVSHLLAPAQTYWILMPHNALPGTRFPVMTLPPQPRAKSDPPNMNCCERKRYNEANKGKLMKATLAWIEKGKQLKAVLDSQWDKQNTILSQYPGYERPLAIEALIASATHYVKTGSWLVPSALTGYLVAASESRYVQKEGWPEPYLSIVSDSYQQQPGGIPSVVILPQTKTLTFESYVPYANKPMPEVAAVKRLQKGTHRANKPKHIDPSPLPIPPQATIKKQNVEVNSLIDAFVKTLVKPLFQKHSVQTAESGQNVLIDPSKSASQAKSDIGPRYIPNFALHDVGDVGNCFYEAVVDQLHILEHDFIQETPQGTEHHTRLRGMVEGVNFSDRRWADDRIFDKFVQQFPDTILAVIDTRNPEAGFTGYYQSSGFWRQVVTNTGGDDSLVLPTDRSIIRIAATGNHFLSVRNHPALTRGIIRNSYASSGVTVEQSNSDSDDTDTDDPDRDGSQSGNESADGILYESGSEGADRLLADEQHHLSAEDIERATQNRNQNLPVWHNWCDGSSPVYTVGAMEFYRGGKDYFAALARDIESLGTRDGSRLTIMGWHLSPDIELANGYSLLSLLRRAHRKAIDIRILIWRNPGEKGGKTAPKEAAKKLKSVGLRKKENYIRLKGDHFWLSHHQKHVTLYNANSQSLVAYFGGIDLAVGRYDDERKVVFRRHLENDPNEFNSHLYNGYSTEDLPLRNWEKGYPRMPWQDVQCKIDGRGAYKVVEIFDHFWASGKGRLRHSLVPPTRSLSPIAYIQFYDCMYQKKKTIQRAMRHHIAAAQRFIYIEQQYFQGLMPGSEAKHIRNLIPYDIVKKINACRRANRDFHVYIVIPLIPDPGNGGIDSTNIKGILYVAHQTREAMKKFIGSNWKKYLSFHYLTQGPDPIYVHSKLMIIDDEVVWLGSANMNDRSLNRLDKDSKCDTELCASIVGAHSSLPFTLRQQLWKEHTGQWVQQFNVPESQECVQIMQGNLGRLRLYPEPIGSKCVVKYFGQEVDLAGDKCSYLRSKAIN
ncbi:MAG: hypothetical protein BGO28_01620 [Alphaproteobacteria bacterium 43-37]|nr:MAG: hypothetical protein BGO28_01620 [Alphaproteobacteria bacterium 43-37]